MPSQSPQIVWFDAIGSADAARVGAKNAALGELIGALSKDGIRVPPGFAVTADAYWQYVDANGLRQVIADSLHAFAAGHAPLAEIGATIRHEFLRGAWPKDLAAAITSAYRRLCCCADGENRAEAMPLDLDVAVRSSVTAADLPDASFAGQQESFLNIRGEDGLLDACRRSYASLFTDRAIGYRHDNGADPMKVALSIGVQRMVRSDLGGAGVMVSIDAETGFDKIVLISAAWGLGENVVQGAVDPDEYAVFKPLLADRSVKPIIEKKRGGKEKKLVYAAAGAPLTRSVPTSKAERAALVLDDRDILQLARWACLIEEHYRRPMAVGWAKDGATGELFIVLARPETVQPRREAGTLRTYRLKSKGRRLLTGASIGDAVVAGRVCLIESPKDIGRFVDGAILVTRNTDPEWLPIMRRAAAIVTDHGGRTSHAAIVSREMGLPAVVGTENGTHVLYDGQDITVSCAEGDEGFVYAGIADFDTAAIDFTTHPPTRTKLMVNMGNPAAAFRWWRMPSDGVGLARMEFVIGADIKVHPMALVHYDRLKDEGAKAAIAKLTAGYADRTEYFVDGLAQGLARIAAPAYPKPVIVRMSDFRSNEFAGLIGGAEFEPKEENPMLGLRGASRYCSPRYREGFALECRAVRRLRDDMGFGNVIVMIPFCRSTVEADRVLAAMAENGLRRGADGLKVYMMCEIPSNVIMAGAFAQRFDGFSIGSNDLTQLTLGVDRDAAALAELFDEQDEAVKWMIGTVIDEAHKAGATIGLCGQAPSDHPEFADFLVDCGIDSISVSPDSFVAVKRRVAAREAQASPRRGIGAGG